MLYAGLDLSRKRLDVHVMDEDGTAVEVTAVRPVASRICCKSADGFSSSALIA